MLFLFLHYVKECIDLRHLYEPGWKSVPKISALALNGTGTGIGTGYYWVNIVAQLAVENNQKIGYFMHKMIPFEYQSEIFE